MNSFLAVVAFAVILAVACRISWLFAEMRDKHRVADIQAESTRARAAWLKRNLELHGEMVRLEAANASLRARNEFLVGLVGADAERAALSGACVDEAGWGR